MVWILLKIGMSPLDIDKYGNTAVHQAAAAGNLKVLQCFLSRGVDVDVLNARGHTPLELATEPETKNLISIATKTKTCQLCESKFDFKNLRYYCDQSLDFFCKTCSVCYWVYEHWESEEMERPVCRSTTVHKMINERQEDLAKAIEVYDFHVLDKSLNQCKNIDIDAKLRKKAEVLHLRLKHENKITTFLQQKSHHENYKENRKDAKLINEMVEKAQDLGIELESKLLEEVNDFTSRLISERDLRK